MFGKKAALVGLWIEVRYLPTILNNGGFFILINCVKQKKEITRQLSNFSLHVYNII